MTLGDGLMGESLLGEDTPAAAALVRPVLAGAMLFDGQTRDFPLSDDGHFESIHSVDSAVQAALFIVAGAIAAAPAIGQTFAQIKSGAGPRVRTDVDNRARTALKALTDRGAIRIIRIEHEQPNRHSLFIAVTYLNLETMSEQTASRLVTATK